VKIIVTVIALLLTISSTSAATLIDRNGNFRGSTTRNADGSTSGPNGERTMQRPGQRPSFTRACAVGRSPSLAQVSPLLPQRRSHRRRSSRRRTCNSMMDRREAF